jgi:hypothetical protein
LLRLRSWNSPGITLEKDKEDFDDLPKLEVDYRSGKPNVAASVELAGASNSSLSERSRTEEQSSVVCSKFSPSTTLNSSQPSPNV